MIITINALNNQFFLLLCNFYNFFVPFIFIPYDIFFAGDDSDLNLFSLRPLY